MTNKKAKEFIDEWNQMSMTDKPVELVPMLVIQCVKTNSNGKFPPDSFVVVEPFLEGEYQKWNSNLGWCPHDDLSINALSHWSYHKSNGQYVFCDMQGVRTTKKYVITDPCIMSVAGNYGPSDCGKEYVVDFMKKHKCNKFCKPEWKKEHGASKFAKRRATMMSWEVKTHVSTH